MSALSSCAHVWIQQSQLGELPPLYLSSRSSESKLKHMEHQWDQVIQQSRDMHGAEALDMIMLQEELEKGMSKEKRIAVQNSVISVKDAERRAVLTQGPLGCKMADSVRTEWNRPSWHEKTLNVPFYSDLF
ncbi:hypothetical protein SBOR_3219 [Sclerotinia borealis F-4128]|uniref:Uncharacterized protein n=1 Tax=Sclerotinia borealis (strain F-4128) TaxID=1432307 RepID=W9CI11_SCLBF|nr:hypothetical protein SBOR_3219 [Sclerotinia borealis F-4128]